MADGVITTHAMVDRLNDLVGAADAVYLTGVSMGGHVTAVSIVQYPGSTTPRFRPAAC